MYNAILYALLLGIFIFLIYYFQLLSLLYPTKRLPVLMYHKIGDEDDDELSVSVENLEKQFAYIAEKGFKTIFFKDLKDTNSKQIIITFDDGYFSNFEYLPELLKKYNLSATIFIATEFIETGYKNNQMMNFDQLRSLDKNLFEIGLHSHSHKNFRDISAAEARLDLLENMQILEREKIPFSRVFAYPYGKFPKNNPDKTLFFQILKELNIEFALRIGNKINTFPIKRPYEICRIDIKKSDNFFKFKLKLLLGRTKLF